MKLLLLTAWRGGYHCRGGYCCWRLCWRLRNHCTFTATMTVVTQQALLRLSLSSTLQHRSFIPADYTAECAANTQWMKLLLLTAVEVVITVEEVTTAGSCAGDCVITRTFLLLMTVVTHLALLRLSLLSTLQHRSLLSQLITAECSDEHNG